MNNRGILLRAPHVNQTIVPRWAVQRAEELTVTKSPDVLMFLAMVTWCYKAGEAADGDAWNLLVHATQSLMNSRWGTLTSVRDARYVIGEVARNLATAGQIPA